MVEERHKWKLGEEGKLRCEAGKRKQQSQDEVKKKWTWYHEIWNGESKLTGSQQKSLT